MTVTTTSHASRSSASRFRRSASGPARRPPSLALAGSEGAGREADLGPRRRCHPVESLGRGLGPAPSGGDPLTRVLRQREPDAGGACRLRQVFSEQLNQLYARLTAGPIPDGAFAGDLFFPKGVSGDVRLSEIVGGVKGPFLGVGTVKAEALGRVLWKGKVFYRDARILRNRIDDLAVLEPVLGDTGDIKKLTFEGATTWLLFPAKLYCGQSLLDGRRESIIIDYAFTDDIEGYREKPDFLAGRRGLDVRDEVRMIRPGLYLGRAYLNRVFVLNFTLYNADIAKRDGPVFAKSGKVAEDCWAGTQWVADLPN